MLQQDLIMEKYLNVLSTPPSPQNGKIEALREEVEGKLGVLKEAIEREAKGNPASEELKRLTKLAKAILGAEGMEITKADVRELQALVRKLEELAAYTDSGAELSAKYELETYVTEQRAKELMTKFYKAMKSEPPTARKVKKLPPLKKILKGRD
jgi:protein tyrosine phosphatase (PTP) superfamily phosphohydrolase (DUF442 family)